MPNNPEPKVEVQKHYFHLNTTATFDEGGCKVSTETDYDINKRMMIASLLNSMEANNWLKVLMKVAIDLQGHEGRISDEVVAQYSKKHFDNPNLPVV